MMVCENILESSSSSSHSPKEAQGLAKAVVSSLYLKMLKSLCWLLTHNIIHPFNNENFLRRQIHVP